MRGVFLLFTWGRQAMVGRSKITADDGERAALRLLARSSHRAEADHARAVLLTLEERCAAEIAAALGVHVSTVREWRGLFAKGRVAALKHRHRGVRILSAIHSRGDAGDSGDRPMFPALWSSLTKRGG